MIGDEFAAVLAAAKGGSEDAFSALWRDANPALLRYLRLMAPRSAEDVAAETWAHVVKGLPGFRGDEASWRAWLFTTARRRSIDDARRLARRPVTPLPDEITDIVQAAPDTADIALENLDTEAAVALVSELPRMQAEVILLRVVAGLETDVVAAMLHRSPGAVRVAAHRGLRRLAERLSRDRVTL